MDTTTQDKEFLKSLTLLYVEDDEDIRGEFKIFLSRIVGKTITATNGAEGVEAFNRCHPDIVLTDISMPIMDGLTMAAKIRETDKTSPIIVLTAFEQNNFLMKSIDIGVDKYLLKPVDIFKLNDALLVFAHRLMLEKQLYQARQEAATANGILSSIIENMTDWVWEVDAEGRYTYCSPQVERFLGYSAAEMLGKTPLDCMTHEEADHIGSLFAEIIQKRIPFKNLDNWNIHKDGRRVLLSTSGVPLLDNAGNLLGYRGVDTDITEQKNLETELRKFARAVEQSPVSIVITDVRGTIEFVNPKFTELTGYSAQEAIGQNPRVLKSGQTPPETFEDLWYTISTGNTWEGELVNMRKDGRLFWEHATISPLRDAGGVITHYLAVKEDITEKKSIMEQLVVARDRAEEADHAKSSFLATMSHEIRTPMNGVIGMAALLIDTELDDQQRGYAEIIRYSGDHLLNLINDILDFSEIESGKIELELLDFDLERMLEETTLMFAERADRAGIKLTCRTEPSVPHYLKGDSGRVRQVLTNLIGNALKFTGQGGVTISASLAEGGDDFATVLFEIHDTGIGIPKSRLDAIFEPFTQASGSTSRKYGGTGLGLAICRQLAELMGGEIGVTSEEGIGSTFWFTARFMTSSAADLQQPVPLPKQKRGVVSLSAGSRNARILLAEDNIINQKVAQGILKQLGFVCDVAADGEEALRALEMIDYDLVLMDCQMPEMSGFEATRLIRGGSSGTINRNLPIIAMTANAMKGDREECLAAGMSDYISKPVKKSELAQILEKWLKLEEAEDRNPHAEAAVDQPVSRADSTVDFQKVTPIINRLLDYISENDCYAEEYLQKQRPRLAELPQKQLQEIENKLVSFDFDEALVTLKELAADIGIGQKANNTYSRPHKHLDF